MQPLTKKLLRWLALLLVGAMAINFAARLLAASIPFLFALLIYVLLAGVLLGRFRSSK
jgi:hypothetical protein